MQTSPENKERNKVISTFFDNNGRLKAIPSQRKKKLFIFEHILQGLEDRPYPEKELNEYIQRFHEDFCTIRREFIINRYMTRDNHVYTLNPQEMWVKIS